MVQSYTLKTNITFIISLLSLHICFVLFFTCVIYIIGNDFNYKNTFVNLISTS
jgi:hypothetical protein